MTEPPVDVWPENWQAVALLLQMDTQWRIGFNGPTGLDHTILFRHLDRLFPDNAAEWDAMFNDVVTLEREALKTMREAKD